MNDTISGLPRLSREYNEGYAKAIKDVAEVFKYVNRELQHNSMRMNYSWVEKILKMILKN